MPPLAEALSGDPSSSEAPHSAASSYLAFFGGPADRGMVGCYIVGFFVADLLETKVLPASAVPKSSEHPVVLPGCEDALLLGAFDYCCCCCEAPAAPRPPAIDAI